jgi:hypothetical protein
MKRVEKKSEPQIIWGTQAGLAASCVNGDLRLVVLVQPNPNSEWVALALESEKIGDAIFEDHAHLLIGSYESPTAAIEAAEGFIMTRIKEMRPSKKCTCTKIKRSKR